MLPSKLARLPPNWLRLAARTPAFKLSRRFPHLPSHCGAFPWEGKGGGGAMGGGLRVERQDRCSNLTPVDFNSAAGIKTTGEMD